MSILMCSNGAELTPPPLDYTAFWLLNTDATDETGNYDYATSNITFDGVGAVFADGATLIPTLTDALLSNDYTLLFWLKRNAVGNSLLYGTYSGANEYISMHSYTDGTIAFTHRNSALASHSDTFGSGIADGAYHLLSFKKTDSSVTVKIDNVLESTITSTNGDYSNGAFLDIGTSTIEGTGDTKTISNSTIFSRALTDEEETNIYNYYLAEHS